MRWIVALMFLGLVNPAMAKVWVCNSTLKLSDQDFGQSDISFSMEFSDDGNFQVPDVFTLSLWRLDKKSQNRQTDRQNQLLERQYPSPRPRGYFQPDWTWKGHWTSVEDQIAMIGATRIRLLGYNPGKIIREMRAFSTVYQDDVMILNMFFADQMVVIRCLPRDR